MFYLFLSGDVPVQKTRSGLTTSANPAQAQRGGSGGGGGAARTGGGMQKLTSKSGPPTCVPDATAQEYVLCLTQGGAKFFLRPVGGGDNIPIRFKGQNDSEGPKSDFPGVIQVDVSQKTYDSGIFNNPIVMEIKKPPEPGKEYQLVHEWLPLNEIKNTTIREIAEKIYAYFNAVDDSRFVGFMVMTQPQFEKMIAARSFLELVRAQDGGRAMPPKGWVVKDLPGKFEEYGIRAENYIDINYVFDSDHLHNMKFDCSWTHITGKKHKRDGEDDGKGESEGQYGEILPGNKMRPCGWYVNKEDIGLLPMVDDMTTVFFLKFQLNSNLRGTMQYYKPEDECPVCYNEIKTTDPVLIPACGHAKFCANCVKGLTKDGVFTCGLCKDTCPGHEIIKSVCIDGVSVQVG